MALVCACLLVMPAVAQPNEARTTAAERLEQLRRTQSRSKVDLAERIGLEFVFALGVGAGKEAAAKLTEIGYHPLPRKGPLPLNPPRTILPARFITEVDALPDIQVPKLPASNVRVVNRDTIRKQFGESGLWMRSEDYALMIEPDPTGAVWIKQPTYLVIRITGSAKNPKANIVAGNVLEAIQVETTPPDMIEHG